jgi:hypothetical protein
LARRVVIRPVNGRPDFPALVNDPTGRDGYSDFLREREADLRAKGVTYLPFPISPAEISREKASRFTDRVGIGGITRSYHAGGQGPTTISFSTLLPYTYSPQWSAGLQRADEFMNSYEIRRVINALVKTGALVQLEITESPTNGAVHFLGRGFITSADFSEPPGKVYEQYWLNLSLAFQTLGGDPVEALRPMIRQGSFQGVINRANRDIRSPILSSYPLRAKDDVPTWTQRNIGTISLWPLVAAVNGVNRDGSFKADKKKRPTELNVPDYMR